MKKPGNTLLKTLCMTLLLALTATAGHAAINGKPVILVHGFQYEHLGNYPNTAQLEQDASLYWQDYWLSRAEAVFYWSSAERINGGIADQIRTQVRQLADAGTCQAGCVVVTHSTGDLVTRHMLRNLNGWLWQWGYGPDRFQVTAVIDLAGAGGGTELANLGVSVIDSNNLITSAATTVVNWFLGTNAGPGELGVVYDLQPAVARNTAIHNSAVPRLRFVGAGDTFARLTKPFILGYDDSVVPLHSACGSILAERVESCSSQIRTDGKVTSVSRAPTGLWHNHYPVLMGDKTDHFEIISAQRSGKLVPVVNHQNLGGLNLNFVEEQYWSWWYWGTMRFVQNSDQKSFSANIFDTLN
ncbi:MAG: hypothetical protein LAT65_01090 [Saccharospirillum sp.]|nr:hypothetical protein [Saccharospirillum sp.]